MASTPRLERKFLRHHSLGIAAAVILICWIVLYSVSDPRTHLGSFFGNAVADWTGVLVTVLATKYLYEIGSAESRKIPKSFLSPVLEVLRDHSLSIFLLFTVLAGWPCTFLWILRPNGDRSWATSFPSGLRSRACAVD